MANLVMDPGLEENTGHTVNNEAVALRVASDSNTGSWCMALVSLKNTALGLDLHGRWRPTLRNLTIGSTYTVKVAAKLQTAGSGDLQIWLDTGDGTLALWASRTQAQAGAGWQLWSPGSFVATGTKGIISVRSQDLTSNGSCQWLVDDLSVEGDSMAVWLAERAVSEATTLLQANLATELAAIDTDRSDALVMTAPASADYHRYERPVVAGSRAQVDIWEGPIDFEGGDLGPGHPYVDSSEARATWRIPIFIRVTFFNENGEDGDTMVDRRRRYEAGVFNVFNKNATGSATYPEIRAVVITGVIDYADNTSDGSAIAKSYTTLAGIVTAEEDQ